jgi:hypothetical protein
MQNWDVKTCMNWNNGKKQLGNEVSLNHPLTDILITGPGIIGEIHVIPLQ